VDHKPLRYRKGQDLCAGKDKPFSIKRNISLGLDKLRPRSALTLMAHSAAQCAHALVEAQEVRGDFQAEGYVALDAERFVLPRTKVLPLAIAQGLVVHESRQR